jgi:DNA-binding IclR family transcriptional regulator
LDVVRAISLSSERCNLTAKVLAADTGTPSITCYRILRTLIANDWIRPIIGGGHELSHGLLALVRQGEPLEGLIAAARPELAKLARKTGLTTKLSIRRNDRSITLCRCESPREASVSVREGAAFPLAYGSSGAVLLSPVDPREIAEILQKMPPVCWKYQAKKDVYKRIHDLKSAGYCVDAGSLNPGLRSISVPVYGHDGNCLAALTVIGFPNDLTPAAHPELKKGLLRCSKSITKRLMSTSDLK